MPLVVDTYGLGPLQTNCYVVRSERGAPEAVVVDPGGDAAQLRLELAGMGTTCAAILITHGHFDHVGGVADLAEGTGAPVYMPEGERDRLERFPTFAPAGAPGRAYDRSTSLPAARRSSSPASRSNASRSPATPRRTSPTTQTAALFSGDLLFAARSAASTCPAPTGTRCSLRSARSPSATARDRRVPRPRAADDARRRARAQPVPRGAARVGREFQAPKGTHDVLPSDHLSGRR